MSTPETPNAVDLEPLMDGSDGLPLHEIQGIILRGYNFDAVRYFVLKISSPDRARALVDRLAEGPDPKISDSQSWGAKRPEYRLQIGFTYPGLVALGLEKASLADFRKHLAFFQGAAVRAPLLGDERENAPEKWIKPFDDPDSVHVIIALYAEDPVLEKWTSNLKALWAGALQELGVQEGHVLPNFSVHFGYQDGISQPTIAGAPPPSSPSKPLAPAASFLLGYQSPWPSFNLPTPQPMDLGVNGSFAAFRMLEQNTEAFEKYLSDAAALSGRDREWMAAKLCGRWRNGVPLMLSPSSPDAAIAESDLNDFSYATDPKGIVCPISSHTRRGFPCDDNISGGPGAAFRRRIIRRGMPYGPQFDRNNPVPAERGLLGLFICASIEEQFEFIQRQWMSKGDFAGSLPRANLDPLIHVDIAGTTKVLIPMPAPSALAVPDIEQLVTTRGAAYIFLPSISALRYIGSLSGPNNPNDV